MEVKDFDVLKKLSKTLLKIPTGNVVTSRQVPSLFQTSIFLLLMEPFILLMAPIFSDDEDSPVCTSPFEYNSETKVMLIRSCNGSVIEVPMDEATMTSFVRNAALMIKTHDVSPRV